MEHVGGIRPRDGTPTTWDAVTSTRRQYNIDQGTELFRKRLEHLDCTRKKNQAKPPVQGGLPPHLLQQQPGQNTRAHSTQGSEAAGPDSHRHTGKEQPRNSSNTFQPPRHLGTSASVFANSSIGLQPQTTSWTHGTGLTGAARDTRNPLGRRQIRPQPAPSPPAERFEEIANEFSSCSDGALSTHQPQQHGKYPAIPMAVTNKDQRAGQEKAFLVSSRDAPGTHPALKGIMSSRWRKAIYDAANSSDQQMRSFSKQTKGSRQQATCRKSEILAPDRDLNDSNRESGVRLSTSPYEGWLPVRNAAGRWSPIVEAIRPPENKTKWRPKNSIDRDSQSLPSSVSSVQFDNDDMDIRYAASDAVMVGGDSDHNGCFHFDHEISNKHCAKLRDPILRNFGWIGVNDAQKQVFRPSKCRDWVDSLPTDRPPVAWLIHRNVEGSEECDVEPRNGFLMAPIEYPPTHINPDDKDRPGAMYRRLCSTATLKSAADFDKNKRRLEKEEKKYRQRELGKPGCRWQPLDDPFPMPRTTSASRAGFGGPDSLPAAEVFDASTSLMLANEPVSQQSVESDVHRNQMEWESYVKVSCFMRPGQPDDLPQVLQIYNWEVVHGTQALDSEPLVIGDMQKIFSRCQSSQTPFIVMIAGTPMEAAIRKGSSAIEPGIYQPRGQKSYQSTKRFQKDRVLGFGFIDILNPGLAGDTNHSVGRFQGRAHFYVAQASRRKGIGRALMSRLAQCCSVHTVSMGEYEWYDPDKNAACDIVPFNARNYSRLFIETGSRGKNDPDAPWLAKLLDSENFFCVCTMEKARRLGNDDNGVWMDNLIWRLDGQDMNDILQNARK